MRFTTIYRDQEIHHWYGTSRSTEGIIPSLQPKDSRVVLVHFHSSVLTCRGAQHAVLVPEPTPDTEPLSKDNRGAVSEDGSPLLW